MLPPGQTANIDPTIAHNLALITAQDLVLYDPDTPPENPDDLYARVPRRVFAAGSGSDAVPTANRGGDIILGGDGVDRRVNAAGEASVFRSVANRADVEVLKEAPLNPTMPEYASLVDGDDWSDAINAVVDLAEPVRGEVFIPPGEYKAAIVMKQGVELRGRTSKRSADLGGGTKITGLPGQPVISLPDVAQGSEDYTIQGSVISGLHLVAQSGQDCIQSLNSMLGMTIEKVYGIPGRALLYTQGFIQECKFDDLEASGGQYLLYKPTGLGTNGAIDRFDKVEMRDLYGHGQTECPIWVVAASGTANVLYIPKCVTCVKDGMVIGGGMEEWTLINPNFEANGLLPNAGAKIADRTVTTVSGNSDATVSSATGLAAGQTHLIHGAGASRQDLEFIIGSSYTPGSTTVPMTTDGTTPLNASTSRTSVAMTRGQYSDIKFISDGSSSPRRITIIDPSMGGERSDSQLRYAIDGTSVIDLTIIGGKAPNKPVYARWNKVDTTLAPNVSVRRVDVTTGNARSTEFGDAAPLTGEHKAGDVIRDNAAISPGWAGWMCVADGNPGTWVKFGATTPIGSKTHDFGSVADGAFESTDVTVTGAVLGDFAAASFSLDLPNGCWLSAHVSATNTVTVTLHNESGSSQDLASGTVRAIVTRRG
jgi:hypothetical protein